MAKKEGEFDWDSLAKPFWGIVKMCLALAVLVFMFAKRDVVLEFFKGAEKTIVNPPISASFRVSGWGEDRGSVLEIANTATDKGVMVTIHRNEIDETSPKFFIKPGEQREFGSWQIGSNFFPGQTGYISVEGYEQKLHFKDKGKRYETWFGE